MGQALYSPTKVREIPCRDESSHDSSIPDLPPRTEPPPLSGTSRVIIKQCFTEVNPICLDPGHPVIALNQDQITSILRIVADESARASFEMLNSVVERASRLNLSSPVKATPRRRAASTSGPDTDTDIGSDSVITYDTRRGDASPGMTSEAESQPDFQSSVAMPAPPTAGNRRQADFESDPQSPVASSPGMETLATIRQEAITEQRHSRKQNPARTSARGPARPRRRIDRVMKEEHFESMPWTRTFVSGPVDPKWNKHKIYCQICKCNVSIRAKGPKEILRHFATERPCAKTKAGGTSTSPLKIPSPNGVDIKSEDETAKCSLTISSNWSCRFSSIASWWTSGRNCRSTTRRWQAQTTWLLHLRIAPKCRSPY